MPYDSKNCTKDKTDSFCNIIVRRRKLVFVISALCFFPCLATLYSATPLYKSTAQLAFYGHGEAFIKTQAQYLKSSDVIQKVVSDIGQIYDPAHKLLRILSLEPTGIAQKHFRTSMHPVSNTESGSSTNLIYNDLSVLINNVKDRITVSHPENSFLIDISYTHSSPEKAARILESIINNYSEQLFTQKEFYTTLQNRKYRDNENSVKENLEKLKISLNTVQETEKKLLKLESNNTENHEDAQYNNFKQEYSKLEKQIQPFLNADGSVNFASTEKSTLNSYTVEQLNKLEKAQQTTLKKLSKRYGNKHPEIRAIKAKISETRSQIEAEQSSLLHKLHSDYLNISAVIKALEAHKKSDSEHLQNSKTAYKEAFTSLEESLKEISTLMADMDNGTDHVMMSVITPPDIPTEPSFPDKPLFIAYSAAISLLLGILFPVIIEKRRNTFISASQIENALDIPCYALIPRLFNNKDGLLADYILNNPSSDIVECVRSLKVNISLKKNINEPKGNTVLFTSSRQGEGKTTICVWLARMSAKSGERVILIDANLRTPAVHTSLGSDNNLSLVEYLTGSHSLDEVIYKKDRSGMHVIYGRDVPNSATDLLSSAKMSQLIETLKETYDLIIIDSPACMTTSDTRALQKHANLLLYIVAWNKTKRNVIHRGLSQFLQSEKQQIATVLSNIDVIKQVQFGYGEVINEYED